MSKNYYEILGVPKNASEDEIKKAYRRKMKDLHPDLHPNDKSLEEQTKEVNEAYEILGNEEKKEQYDLTGETPSQAYQHEYQTQANTIVDSLIDDLSKRFSENSPFSSSTTKVSQKDFDDFMEYLTKMDEHFKEFGLTSTKVRKSLETKRGVLTPQEINSYKNSIESQLRTLTKNAKYYDDFIYLYEKVKTEVNTWNPQFNEEEFKSYIDKKNRGHKTQDFFAPAQQKLNELNLSALKQKNQEINEAIRELEKRNIKELLFEYMRHNHIHLSSNLTKSDLNYLKEFIILYDKTNTLLSSMKINMLEMLYKMHKYVETLTLEELKVIYKCAEEMNQKDLLAKWKLSNTIKSELDQMNSPKM